MKLKPHITPDSVAAMAAEVKAGEKAVTAAMREAGTRLKTAWRLKITGAGLGPRLANSIRSQTYPKAGESLKAAALVWSKAPVIVGAHDTGPLIRSKDGFWLAIPTEAAGRGLRGGKITPGEWERRRGLRLRFVYRRTGPIRERRAQLSEDPEHVLEIVKQGTERARERTEATRREVVDALGLFQLQKTGCGRSGAMTGLSRTL